MNPAAAAETPQHCLSRGAPAGPPADIIVLHEVSRVTARSENNLSSAPLGGVLEEQPQQIENIKYIVAKEIPQEFCFHLL